MQLRKLEMYGFKTFASKTILEFDEGLTEIVGPNGSGKSNIIDAIRFALGELNLKTIRANKGVELIFSGGQQRRSSGVAEVLLTFDNFGKIPIEFKEIVVNRRIFNTGESEFFINRSRCRLKDIVDMFADTGLGSGGISIISQNRVEEVLKAKPDERRIFFEEAIGVTKYKNRKRETLQRIDDTENNLLRVADIISEIENQLKPLSIQAERTNKYNTLDSERHDLKLIELQRKQQDLIDNLNQQNKLKQTINDNLTELQTKFNDFEVDKEQLSKEIVDIEQKIFSQSADNESIRRQFDNTSKEIAKLTERNEQSQKIIKQNKQNQQKLSTDLETSNANLAALKSALNQQREEFVKQQQSLKTAQKESAELESNLQTHNEQRRQFENIVALLNKKLSTTQNELLIVEHDLSTFSERQQSFEANENGLLEEIAALNKEVEILNLRQQTLDETSAQIKLRHEELNTSLKFETQNYRALKNEVELQVQERREIETKLQILQKMKSNYEGFAKAPKAVLTSKAAWRNKICGAVGELLTVPVEFTTAIDIALGGNVNNIVTEDEETAKLAIEFLKRDRLGRVTFLPLSRIVTLMSLFDIQEAGVIGFANKLVKTEKRFQKVADFLLSKTLIVDNIDSALKIAKRHNIRIVTLEGEVLNVGGSISGGSSRQVESNIFSRSGEIFTLNSKLNVAIDKIDTLQNQKATSEKKLNSLNEEIANLSENFNSVKVENAEVQFKITQTNKLLKDKQKNLNDLRDSLSKYNISIDELNRHKKNSAELIATLQIEIDETNVKFNAAKSENSEIEQKFKIINKKSKQLEIDCAVHEQKIIRTESQIELLQNRISAEISELKNLQATQKSLLKDLSADAVKIAKLNKETELTQTRFSYGQEQLNLLHSAKMDKLANVATLEKDLREVNRKISIAKNQLHDIELVISQLQIKIVDYQDESAKIGKVAEIVDDLKLSNESISTRLNEIETALQEIGAVNPNAPQEFSELNARCEFLKKQLNDLESAKNNLQVLMTEIDGNIVTQFDNAFKKIQELFCDVFVKLFGGGNAKLELTNPNDLLQTGVEITVALPKRKRQPLSLLSGGERALTVIALLFAFLKFRPAPLCILDEVDAPLDEANLLRFGGFLRELAKDTQFIVITHRKSTMEFADRIYGVTMENGVSKILSVNLSTEIA